MKAIICVLASCVVMSVASPFVMAQESANKETGQPEVVDLVEIIANEPAYLIPKKRGEFETARTFDINRDGIDDLAFQISATRGPLSTYFSNYRLLALGKCRILKSGEPLEKGDSISMVDLMEHSDHAFLCSLGASLRLIDEPASTFNTGPWWNRDAGALALLIYENEQPQVGYVQMSVSKNGSVTFGKSSFVAADNELITVVSD